MTTTELSAGTGLPFPAKPAVAAQRSTRDAAFTIFTPVEGLDDEALDALNLPPDASYFVRKEQYDHLYEQAKALEHALRGEQAINRTINDEYNRQVDRLHRLESESNALKNTETRLRRDLAEAIDRNKSLEGEVQSAQEAASDAQKEVENTREFWNTAHSDLQGPSREKIEFVDADPPTLAARMDAIVLGFELLWQQNKDLNTRLGLLDGENKGLQGSVRSIEKRMAKAEQEFPSQLAQIRRMIESNREFTASLISQHGKSLRKLAKKVRKLQQVP